MAQPNVSLDLIQDFLSQKRIALIGISRNPHDIGVMLLKEFERRGSEVILVNPNVPEIAGHRCCARVQDVQPAPDAALLLTSPSVTDQVVRGCAEAGIKRVWMYRGGGQGAVSLEAIEFCRQNGISVVPGQCPMMFLKPVRHVHWIHKMIFKISGAYPKQAFAQQ